MQFNPNRGNIFTLIAMICLTLPVQGQEEISENEVDGWQLDLKGLLSATQISFSNWNEGGVNTLGYSAEINGEMNRQTSRWKQLHSLRLAFGQIKQDELDFRKSIDIVQHNFNLQNIGTMLFNPTLAMEFRTQFAQGFNFKKNPFKDGREPPVKVSVFRFCNSYLRVD